MEKWQKLVLVMGITSVLIYLAFDFPRRFPFVNNNIQPTTKSTEIYLLYAYEHIAPGFCASLRTAMLNDWRPVALSPSADMNLSIGREKNMVKIFLTDLFLAGSEIRDNDIVMVVDAYDTWIQHTPQHLVELFQEMEQKSLGDSVLFSAEKNCWPPGSHCEGLPESSLPVGTYGTDPDDSQKKYRRPKWLNSGGYIGRKSNVQQVLKLAIEAYHDDISDQELLGRIYHDQGTENLIQLDFSSVIFQSMSYSADDLIWVRDYMSVMDGKIRPLNKFSGTQPVVVHFNGDKNMALYHWRQSNPAINETLDIRTQYLQGDGKVVSYGETCTGKFAVDITQDKIW